MAVLVDYVRMSVIRGRYKALRVETAEQKSTIAGYEKSISELQTKISNLESYTKKLNIMAGLKSPDVLTAPAGVGGGDPGKDEPEPNIEQPAQAPAPAGPQVINPGTIQNLSQKAQSIESNLTSLLNFFESDNLRLASTPSIMPTAGWIARSSATGTTRSRGPGRCTGASISPPTSGTPSWPRPTASSSRSRRTSTWARTSRSATATAITTVYGHMSNFAVKAGQKVKRRDIIGYIGQTGKAAGPHVHYEVFKDGKRIDPRNFLLEE